MNQQLFLFPEDRERERLSLIPGTPEWQKRYDAYIKSPQWQRLRLLVLQRAGNHCERCDCETDKLDVHHLTYERFGRELLTDLQAVCAGPCHLEADAQRRRNVAAASEEARKKARYAAGLDTYLTKRYGEDSALRHYLNPEPYEEQFNRFLRKSRRHDLN